MHRHSLLSALLLGLGARRAAAVEDNSIAASASIQTPVGAQLPAADVDRTYDLCGTGGSADPTLRLADYQGSTVLVVATFYTGCSPGRLIAPTFASFCAAQKALHGDAVQCITSLKGSSACTAWSRRYYDLDGDRTNDDADIPLTVTDTDSALHYSLFDGNPQFAVLDKDMTVRLTLVGTSARQQANVEGLADLVATLVAEPAGRTLALPETPIQLESPVTGGARILVGGSDGWGLRPEPYPDITAAVGDTLVFTYSAGYHDVMLVDNPNCDFSAGTMLDETGEYEYEITEPGEYFFACTFGGHCSGGNHQVRVIVPAAVDASGEEQQQCAPAFGQQSAITVEFTNDEGLDSPRDLQFHPLNPDELWVANNDTDSLTIIDTVAGTAVTRKDRAPYHYMERISSLAFDSRGYFATCQESDNTYDDMMIANHFMGPTLFHSAESDLVNQLGEPECNTEDPDTTCFFTHWDMLHESPLCMGIAHDPEDRTPFGNVYWAFDGLNSSLIRYDFSEPHGPGSLDHSIAAIRRYPEIELTRVPGIPGHLMMDPTERVLYIADTGGGRILRMNPDSGHFIRTAKREFPIYSSIAETFEYSIYGCAEWEVFADGLDKPSGLHVDDTHVYVAEWQSSTIVAFDKASGTEVSRVNTGASGLNGIAVDSGGHIWFSDGPSNTVSKVTVELPCAASSDETATSSPVEWPERECTMVVDNNITIDHTVHTAGYMNLSGFLGIADYADAEVHHCGGNSVTLSAAMAGMPTADADGNYRMNNDALLMEGYLCHVCLPEPCSNGGVCSHIPWGFTCDCSGTGYGGDTCDSPLPESESCVGDLTADLLVNVEDLLMLLGQYGSECPVGSQEHGDFNSDGFIGVADLLLLLSQFGRQC